MNPDERKKIYGRTHTPRDENLENVISTVKGIGLAVLLGLGTMAIYATSEAGKKLNLLKEDFRAAAIANNSKVLGNILEERNKIVKQYGCLPQTWKKNYDNTFYFSDTTCFIYQK